MKSTVITDRLTVIAVLLLLPVAFFLLSGAFNESTANCTPKDVPSLVWQCSPLPVLPNQPGW